MRAHKGMYAYMNTSPSAHIYPPPCRRPLGRARAVENPTQTPTPTTPSSNSNPNSNSDPNFNPNLNPKLQHEP